MIQIPPIPTDVPNLDPANILHDEFPGGIPPTFIGGPTRFTLPFQDPELWDRIAWTCDNLQTKLNLPTRPEVTGWYVPIVQGPGGQLRSQAQATISTPSGFEIVVQPYNLMRFPDTILYVAARGARPGWEGATDVQPGPLYPGFLARQGTAKSAVGPPWPDHDYSKPPHNRAIFRDSDNDESRYKPNDTIRLEDGVYIKGMRVFGSWLMGTATKREYFWERIGRA